MRSRAFTLIELLVSIAIIGLLIGLLIPNIDRSLSKNQIVNDVDLFKSKLEEVRLLSGSTQQVDESNDSGDADADETGYYAIVIPKNENTYFGVVRIAYPLGSGICTPEEANAQLIGSPSNDDGCVVEKISLSKNVKIVGAGIERYLSFRVPTQKMFSIESSGTAWVESKPVFSVANPVFELTYPGLKAKVSLDDYTARVTVEYEKIPNP